MAQLYKVSHGIPLATSARLNAGSRLNAASKPIYRLRRSDLASRTRAEAEDEQQPTTTQEQQNTQPTVPEEEPIWVRRERERELIEKEGGNKELPFGAYLLFSAIVAIAAVGSLFEWSSKHPIFDVITADSPLYTPILGFFALTGFPMSAFLFFKSIQAANKEAERMDKLDGY